jgi:REP element-mobilizing transposase RayT
MPQPRYTQIDIEATPFYHCISRCVRRAFLCGTDRLTGKSFDHRKGWIVEKLADLCTIFAVRVCAYGVLSSHFHLVLCLDSERARTWSDEEVVSRHGRLFRHSTVRWQQLPPGRGADCVARWRARLYDLSWFMRCLNESIARRANAEDHCTGRFWEGRFRSQALLDEAALLTCMSYVDLNPIRAGMAATLEESDFTSIQQRLEEAAREQRAEQEKGHQEPEEAEVRMAAQSQRPRRPELSPFARPGQIEAQDMLAVEFGQYVELLAATGAVVRGGSEDAKLPEPSRQVLNKLGIASEHWVETVVRYHRHFFAMVGHVHRIAVHCARIDRDQAKGSAWAAKVFRASA